MNLKREFTVWGCLAAAAIALLAGVLVWQQRLAGSRAVALVQPNPLQGSAIFAEKGCATCHGNAGLGGSAPALRGRESLSTLSQLVVAMWNHAPRMWQAIDEQRLQYPTLSYEETGQLVAFLYFSRYADQSGDPAVGREVFDRKKCRECHLAIVDETAGSAELVPARVVEGTDLKTSKAVENPIVWTQIMWNHAAQMQSAQKVRGIHWPRFELNEMRHLIAYVRQETGNKDGNFSFPATDPDEGWTVFQRKGCVRCHSLGSGAPGVGPSLGIEHNLPPSFSEFGAMMLNHFPKMEKALAESGQQFPMFEGREMSDLVGFLYSLHYVEPAGTAPMGRSTFRWRGCAQCHGVNAEGTSNAPALRGLGRNYTTTRLSTDLWRHGSRMHQQGKRNNQPWPKLEADDVGNLLAYLNSPLSN